MDDDAGQGQWAGDDTWTPGPGWIADLTERQVEILAFIHQEVRARGYAPSMREIGRAMGMTSPSSVKYQLRILELRGYLRRDPKTPRAMELTGIGRRMATRGKPLEESPHEALIRQLDQGAPEPVFAPLIGRIAAGGPILAEQAVEDLMPLPRTLTGEGDLFILKVVGESMTGAAICDGDFVVVRSQPIADNGEIVAALIDGEATVKTLRRTTAEMWLMPQNPAFEPIPGADAQILGKVVCVLRAL
ncbi:MAG: transcriptional repressor LexA [Micrococcales bacterium]|nr:transcriptional repressor LexA [Micrococcales bacterium]